ncbi:PepSY-associated TM helix domain-containing protein [Saccharopolyspora flava]|uniref:Uncharacterized iron-regulated membrane protein n=1 Tax=Saccharopolyspora flava TaxID=95161 RepID=A0A1I6SRR3_9PSEU|nr:PepSY domain-containing protein [Saccharopolyspora flava]SFS79651.1 Uncharacterized iron-regulated membrane protein [Saccharopolyspora flava]
MVANDTTTPERADTPPAGFRPWRQLALRVHFYAGVLVAPFLLVVAFTGLLYVFAPQLEAAVYAHQLRVPAAATETPLATQVEAARSALPGTELKAVRPAADDTSTTQVIFTTDDLPDSHYRTVFVAPRDAEVRGVLETYGSDQALPLRTWLDELHRNLHLGEVGRLYSELAASWLWVVVLGGLALWFSRHRRARALRTHPPGRARVVSWHGIAGAWLAAGLLFLSATGLTWSTFAGDTVSRIRAALSWQTPVVANTVPAPAAGTDIGFDRVREIATASGLTGRVEITPPAGAGSAYTVQEVQRSWPTQQDAVAVHPETGAITDSLRFADYPLMAKLSRWGIDAHMGLLFGWVNQVVLAALMITLIATIGFAYRMWWLRRPTRGVVAPPPRGAWRALPRPAVPAGVLALCGLGYALPVLGVSLLAFLVVDVLLGLRSQIRAG